MGGVVQIIVGAMLQQVVHLLPTLMQAAWGRCKGKAKGKGKKGFMPWIFGCFHEAAAEQQREGQAEECESHDAGHFEEVPAQYAPFPFFFGGKGWGRKPWCEGKGKKACAQPLHEQDEAQDPFSPGALREFAASLLGGKGLLRNAWCKGKGKGKGKACWAPWTSKHEADVEAPSSSSSVSSLSSDESGSEQDGRDDSQQHRRREARQCSAQWKQARVDAKRHYKAQIATLKEQVKATKREFAQEKKRLKMERKALKRERKVEHTKQDQQKQQRRQEQEQMQTEQKSGTSVPALLQALCEMGFGNAELNAELLEAHGEDLQKVLEVLTGGAGWQVL